MGLGLQESPRQRQVSDQIDLATMRAFSRDRRGGA